MNGNELLTKDDINNIIFALDNTTNIFKECRLFDHNVGESRLMDPTKYISDKKTNSLTDIIDTRLHIHSTEYTPRVFLKIWMEWNKVPPHIRKAKDIQFKSLYKIPLRTVINDVYTTSLEYESRIYQFITDNIILRDVSPNFIPILVNHSCSIGSIIESLTKFKERFAKDVHINFEKFDVLFKKLEHINLVFRVYANMRFIMTGSAPNVMTMTDFCALLNGDQNSPLFIQKLKRDIMTNGLVGTFRIDEYKAILFQFFYIFYVLYRYRIVHNDNHFQNILIQVLDAPVTFEFNIHGKVVSFSTQYVVKIFDWDRAYREGEPMSNDVIKNKGLANAHLIARFVPNRDFIQFLCDAKKINVFNVLLNKLVPSFSAMKFANAKPEITIAGVVNQEFKEWVVAHPDNIFTADGFQYVTISREELEKMQTLNLQAIKSAVDDKFDKVDFYKGVRLFYFRIENDDLVLTTGWKCSPTIDELAYNVEDYFTTPHLFKLLTDDLRVRSVATSVYKYAI